MDQAARKTRDLGSAAEKLSAQKAGFTEVGRSMLAVGTVAAVAVGLAIKSFADFDAKMSQVKTLSHASADDMKLLTSAALHMGQAIGYSANDVADAEIELVKAGRSTAEIMGGALKGSLELAAAGQIEVSKATEIATIAMTQFALKGKDIPHVADLLSAGADKALGGVGDLGEALKSGGLVAAQFGVSLDETVGTLSAFANAGLLGETAGTDLRQMLLKLGNPSKEAADKMKELGISIYDASGKFVGINNLSLQLFKTLHDKTPDVRNSAEAIIFGSRAIAGANVLYNEGGKSGGGIQKWTNAVNDAGFASRQASGKMDNLKGDISKLGAAFNTDIIESGSGANDALRMVVKGATGLLTVIGNLPGPLLGVGLGITGVVAGTALLGGGFLIAVPKIAAMQAAMKGLNITGKGLALNFGKGGLIMAALAAITVGMAGAGSQAELTAEQLAKIDAASTGSTKSLDKLFTNADGAFKSGANGIDGFKSALNGLYSSDFFKSDQANKNVGGFFDSISFGATTLATDLKKFESQFKHMGTVLADTAKTDFPAANDQFQKYIEMAGGGKEATRQLLEAMPDYKAELISLAGDMGKTLTPAQLLNLAMGKGALASQIAAASTAKQNAALDDLSGKSITATGDIKGLADAIKGFGGAQLDVNAAEREFQAAIDDVTKSVTDNGTSLDIGTDAGRQNQASLDAIAKTALSAASAIVTQTGSQEDATKAVQDGRDALIVALGQFGITGAAAQTYADKLGLIPGNVGTAVTITGVDDASAKIDILRGKLEGIAKYKTDVQVTATQNLKGTGAFLKKPSADGNMFVGGTAKAFADGGIQSGIYAGRPGGLYKFAEPETGWEAFISGKPGQNARNRSIWADAGQRLGIQAPASTTTHTTHAPITINQVVDPIGTGMAVQRRLQGKAA